jgi:HK97 family phage prohead protease
MHESNPVQPALAEFSERLVSLCDGRPGLRSGLHVDIREPGAATGHGSIEGESGSDQPPITDHPSPVLDFVASSERLDRYDEIVLAKGWILDNYRRNPVFQNAHKYGDIIFTLGKALQTEVRDGRLYQRIEFATDVNPMAKIGYGLYRGKFLNAVSVGFIPIRWETGGAESGYRRKYLEQELLEVSAVGIPANPEALQLGLKAGAIERADVKDLLELIQTLSQAAEKPAADTHLPISQQSLVTPFGIHPAAANTLACASGVRGYEAQWLRLARLLRDALKR